MIKRSSFGIINGQDIDLVSISNKNGLQLKLLSYGAAIQSLMVPGRDGSLADVVLGFDTIEAYQSDPSYIGVICGRYANRIGGSSFGISGENWAVVSNEGPNCLHGGKSGFNKKVWTLLKSDAENEVCFEYISADLEEGFPGTMTTRVTYSLTEDNSVTINYQAITDKPTYVNLTNHSYFNLAGASRDVLKHELLIRSAEITKTDQANIPTGKLLIVDASPYDFTRFKVVGKDAATAGGGYDNNFILTPAQAGEIAAILRDPESGRVLECFTSEPAIQLYTANHFNGTQIGKGGIAYKKHFGLCLEAQHFPDSMHHPSFPSTLLLPGQKYKQQTVYRFSAF